MLFSVVAGIYTLKYHSDGSVDQYKARLAAKGYTQTYGVDYFEIFSPVARLSSIMILFSLAVNLSWTFVLARYLVCLLVWWFVGGDIYGVTFRVCCSRGRIKFIVSGRQYMNSSRVHMCDLRSLTLPFLTLGFIVVTQITLSLLSILSMT